MYMKSGKANVEGTYTKSQKAQLTKMHHTAANTGSVAHRHLTHSSNAALSTHAQAGSAY